ncbi:small-subunit processome [Gongronella butleri]|nr:small-subunit processome [Gongronella butleri]
MARSQQKKKSTPVRASGGGAGGKRGKGFRANKNSSTGLDDVFEADDDNRQLQRRGHTLDEVDNYEYQAGDIDEDDDEEIDSDDAFDDEDNDKFDHFKFAGSTKDEDKPKKKQTADDDMEEPEIDLNEESADDDEDDEAGDDCMDLADMLDDDGNSDDAPLTTGNEAVDQFLEDDDDSASDSDVGSFKGFGSDNDDDDAAAAGGNDMMALISSLAKKSKAGAQAAAGKKRKLVERNELYEENEFNLPNKKDTQGNKLDLADMMGSLDGEASLGDVRSTLQQLTSKKQTALSAPLAQPIQDRLERQAAYQQATKEINRWESTVLENRSADHLHFPMQNADSAPNNLTSASLASQFVASTNLEKQIEAALQQAGMKDEELEAFEALKLNKLSVEEVEARRKELAMMRELMYRHEKKARRMKKIKSKSYRKLKRKEKARAEDLAKAHDVDHEMDEEDAMEAARARAEERMTLKHKNTGKWAKRALARGQLDEGTRDAIMEQLQRGEQLRRKIHGKEGDQDSDASSSSSDDDDDDDHSALQDKLAALEHDLAHDTQPKKGILAMKFMQDAEARERKETLAELTTFRDEMFNDDQDDESKEEVQEPNFRQVANNPGRVAFGANIKEKAEVEAAEAAPKAKVAGLSVHGQLDKVSRGAEHTTRTTGAVATVATVATQVKAKPSPLADLDTSEANPWLQNDTSRLGKKASKSNKAATTQGKPKQKKGAMDDEDDVELDLTQVLTLNGKQKKKNNKQQQQKQKQKQPTAANGSDQDDDSSDDDNDTTPAMVPTTNKLSFTQRDLVAQAFADDKVVEEFEQEKQNVIAEDDDKVEDLTLPGWGAWGGKGVKKNKKKNKITKVTKGISADKRKDAKLANVIINEKRHKKAEKYQSTTVPFPFKTMEQYEHSLRAPLGKEWNTTEIHRKVTKPKIITKLGTVIDPLSAPFK